MKPEDLYNRLLETCKVLGIPTMDEKCNTDEEFKKKVSKGFNQSLNDYITKNYSKYEQEAKDRIKK